MHIYQCGNMACRFGWLDNRPPIQRFGQDPYGRPIAFWVFPPCVHCGSPMVAYLGQQVYSLQRAGFDRANRSSADGKLEPDTGDQGPERRCEAVRDITSADCRQPSVRAQLTNLRRTPAGRHAIPAAQLVNLNDPFDILPEDVLKRCSLSWTARRCGSSAWRRASARFGFAFLECFLPTLRAYGSMVASLQPIILKEIGSAKTLNLAIDKVPNSSSGRGSILEFLVGSGLQVNLLLGTKDDKTLAKLNKASKNAAQAIEDLPGGQIFAKMHDKIWVLDDDGVITGSPNISWTAMNLNVESMIVIRNRQAASLFTRYINLLKSASPASGPEFDGLRQDLVKYNQEDRGLKLAMAPLMNVTDFVIEHLADATKIVIRQYVISPAKPNSGGPDVLKVLCEMAMSGVDIEIYLDEALYNEKGFVRLGVNALVGSGCKVYLQKLVKVVNANAEACVHDKLILAEIHGGVQKTLIGSAGFSTQVIANKNAENFICTDSRSVYKDFMKHHRIAISSPEDVAVIPVTWKGNVPGQERHKFHDSQWLRKFM